MAHEPRTGLQQFGRILQAFGDPGFLDRERTQQIAEAERTRELDESRKLAMLQDNRDLLGLLKNKQIPRARQLLTDRLGDLRTLGSADTSDTEEMLGFLDTDPAKALSESRFLDDMAITRQLLPAAAAPESFTLSPGQTRFFFPKYFQ